MTHITNAAENLVAIATAHLEVVKAQILMITSAPCIEKCNSICVFPETGLTIGVDGSGKPIIVNSYTPTQFTPATAREICANVTNGRGESKAAVGAPQARVRAIIQPKSKTAPAEDTAPALQLQPTPGMRSAP